MIPFDPLVEASWLRAELGEPDLVVVDCRFVLGRPGAGEEGWRAGHLPGAAYLDVDRDLAGQPGERGRHPLPEQGRFEAAARRAGIGSSSRVVAYDEAGEGGAARLWWLLRHFGHADVAVLNGGLGAWHESGGELVAGDERPERGDFVAAPGAADAARSPGAAGTAIAAGTVTAAGTPDTADRDELGRQSGPLLLDARAPERYRGELEPIDPLAGHIPGAVNLPFAELAPQGRFRSPDEIRERFAAVGATAGAPLVAYCGSGVTACTLVLAAELAGLGPVRLYPGSWSEWSRRGLPVETGG